MKLHKAQLYPIAYRWLSFSAVAGFILYWLATAGNIYFKGKMEAVSPYSTALHKVFWRQNWRLFAYTKLYNRQLNVIVRSNDSAAADTTDLVQYSLAQKRKHAPFNNYEEGIDRVLYTTMNVIEARLGQDTAALKKQKPGNSSEFYILEASALLIEDPFVAKDLYNLEAFAKKMLEEKKINTAGKEYQLQITHKFIPPQLPKAGSFSRGDTEVIFQTVYKKFQQP